eukprot:gene19327-biopygen20047
MILDNQKTLLLKNPATTEPARRAHLNLLLEPGAGCWLTAISSPALGTAVAPQLFVVALQRRLRLPIFAASQYCAFCDGVVDVFADHALVCSGGGDRTVRHNLLRNAAFRVAHAAGLRPELEKPGLLRPRPCV